MPTLRQLIKQSLDEIIAEETEIPTQDGSSSTATPSELEKAKKDTQSGETIKFVKPGQVEEDSVGQEEIPVKVSEAFQSIQEASEAVADIEDFGTRYANKKFQKLAGDLAGTLVKAKEIISQLKGLKDEILAEEQDEISEYGDKIVKCMSKHLKTEEQGKNLKNKYMRYIQAAFRKGKKPQEVAERIKDHRFEL